jgi:hypothetical protein
MSHPLPKMFACKKEKQFENETANANGRILTLPRLREDHYPAQASVVFGQVRELDFAFRFRHSKLDIRH